MKKLLGLSVLSMVLTLALAACSVAEGRLPTREETAAAIATAQAFATQAAPYVEAGAEAAATAAVNMYDTSVAAQATLEAAGIDSRYVFGKLRALNPDENGNVILTLTETEVDLILGARQLFVDQDGTQIALERTRVQLVNGAVVVTGTVWDRPLTAVFQPYVADGQVQLNVVSAAVSDTPVPAFVVSAAQTTLNSSFNTALAGLPDSVILRSIVVYDGYLTLTAGRL